MIATRKTDLRNNFIIKNKNVFVLFFVMLFAVCFGVLIAKYDSDFDFFYEVSQILDNYLAFIKINSKPEIFIGLLLSSFVCYAVVSLLSTSVIGAPLIYAVVFFKIAGLSAMLYVLYTEYGLKGLEFSVLVLLPGKYLMLLSLFLLADSSTQICNSIIKDTQLNSEKIKKYAMILLVTAVIMLLSVIIDYLAQTAFCELFTF